MSFLFLLFLNCSQFKELHIIWCIPSGVYYNLWSNFPWKLTCQCEIVILMIVNQNVATYLEYSREIFAACKSCAIMWVRVKEKWKKKCLRWYLLSCRQFFFSSYFCRGWELHYQSWCGLIRRSLLKAFIKEVVIAIVWLFIVIYMNVNVLPKTV